MPHNILENDIQVGVEQAWHGLTTVVESITRENAGIVYGMELKENMFLSGYKQSGAVKRPIYARGQGKQIVCSDGIVIGQVSDTFALISHEEIFQAVLDGIKGTDHKLVSCLTVQNRAIGGISVSLGEFKGAGEQHASVLNLTWGNTGAMPLIAKLGVTKQVCNNTINVALGEKGDTLARIRHTKNQACAIENLGEIIAKAIGVRGEFQAAMDSFEEIEVKEDSAKRIFAGFITPASATVLSTRAKNTVDRLTELYNGGAGNNGRTLGDAFGAITDFYSHESSGGDNQWKQFVSSEFGSGQKVKEQAFNTFRNKPLLAKVEERGEALLSLAN